MSLRTFTARVARLESRLPVPRVKSVICYEPGKLPDAEDLAHLGVAGVMLCPRFASLGEWELAARQQQRKLLFEVRQ